MQAGELGILFQETSKTGIGDLVTPWDLPSVACDVSFKQFTKKNAPSEMILQHFFIFATHVPYNCFYTDASKSVFAVSCAAHGPSFNSTKTMNLNTSIFTVEAHGILLAVTHIIKTKTQQSVIFTDS